MSQSQPRHAAPNPKRNIKAIRTVRFWAAPLLITLALMSALCALYRVVGDVHDLTLLLCDIDSVCQ